MKVALLFVLVLSFFGLTIIGGKVIPQRVEARTKQTLNSTAQEIERVNKVKSAVSGSLDVDGKLPASKDPKDCDPVKCGLVIAACAVACADAITEPACVACLGPLYADCKDCF